MRDYRNEMDYIKGATHKSFEFDIYKINKFEEWEKIKTIKLINYDKKFNCSGSGGCSIFNRKNGKELELLTIETWDIATNPEKYNIDLDENSRKNILKKNYITLSTLNTIDLIAENENWDYI
jgi:hypothetical protein